MKRKWWMPGLAAVALLVAVLGLGARQPMSAFAADPAGQAPAAPTAKPDRVAGHVTSTGEQSLALQTVRGDTANVHYTDQTVCAYRDGSSRTSCSEIAAGDLVVARGQRAGDSDQFLADHIVVTPPGAVGHVTAVNGALLTVQTHSGQTATVAFDDTTVCREDKQAIDCATIAVGDRIAAAGPTTDGTLQASRINVVRQRTAGTVTAFDGQTLTLQAKQGAASTVALSSTTKCYANTQPADCSSIAVGDHVAAGGFMEGGVLQAIRLDIVTKLPAIRGTVTDVAGREFDLRATDGTTHRVHWADDTTCQAGAGLVSCDTIAAGDRATVRGTDLGADNVQAKRIAFRAPRVRRANPGAAPDATPAATQVN